MRIRPPPPIIGSSSRRAGRREEACSGRRRCSQPRIASSTLWGESSPVSGTRGAPASSRLPRMRGRRSRLYSSAANCSWTSGRFSSTNRISSRPLANASAPSGSSGQLSRHLVERQAQLRGSRLVDSQRVERLAHVEIGLAGGDDAQPAPRAVDHHAVESVGAREGLGRRQPHVVEVGLGDDGPAHALGVAQRVLGQDDADPLRIDRHRAGALDGVRQALEADPAARVAGQRPAVQSVVR